MLTIKDYNYIRITFRYKENDIIKNCLEKAKAISGIKQTNKLIQWCIKRAIEDYQKLAIKHRDLNNKYKNLNKKYTALTYHLQKIRYHNDELNKLLDE